MAGNVFGADTTESRAFFAHSLENLEAVCAWLNGLPGTTMDGLSPQGHNVTWQVHHVLNFQVASVGRAPGTFDVLALCAVEEAY